SMIGVVRLYIYFFFSSRRRHTSFSRDWSSDVCSSDLDPHGARGLDFRHEVALGIVFVPRDAVRAVCFEKLSRGAVLSVGALFGRSEERRVGKEWKSQGALNA